MSGGGYVWLPIFFIVAASGFALATVIGAQVPLTVVGPYKSLVTVMSEMPEVPDNRKVSVINNLITVRV